LSLSTAQLLEVLPRELSPGAGEVLNALDRIIFGGRLEKNRLEEVFNGIEGLFKQIEVPK
ncbi:MAG TPA: hypothetical protein ACFYD5_04265, partial [Candidatus Tripitaka sp. YC43]